jgi:hypothetical protein
MRRENLNTQEELWVMNTRTVEFGERISAVHCVLWLALSDI